MNLLRRLLPGIALVMGAFLLSVGLQTLAFTEPSAGPTGGTVYAPVNTGGTAQTKSGNFTSSGTLTGNIVSGTSQMCLGGSCISSWGSAGDVGLQRRVSGTCVVGSSIRVINSDGTVSCETDDGGAGGGTGTVTSVATNNGITGGTITTSGTLGLNLTGISSCTNATSNKIYWNGSYLACGTDQTGGAGGLSGSGSTNYVSKWSGGTSLGNSLIYDNGTNVGIGTTVPNGRLTIGGNPSDLVLQNGVIYINTSYTTSQLQLYGRDIRTTNNENLYLNWSNASGNIIIGGEGENKTLYMAGGSGAAGSGSYIDTADYYIRSTGRWASQMIDFSAAGASISITPTNSIQSAMPGGISGNPRAAILNFSHDNSLCNDSVVRLYKGGTDLGNILGRVNNGEMDFGGAFAIIPLTSNYFAYKEAWKTSGFCAMTVRTIGFIY